VTAVAHVNNHQSSTGPGRFCMADMYSTWLSLIVGVEMRFTAFSARCSFPAHADAAYLVCQLLAKLHGVTILNTTQFCS
jgi:hypothetical protein